MNLQDRSDQATKPKLHRSVEPSRQRSLHTWFPVALDGSEAELAALARLENRNFPDEPTTPEILRHRALERQSFCFAREEAVWRGGRIIGYGSLHRAWWLELHGRYRIYVSVDRDWRRQGIGTRLWDRLLSLAAVTERIRWLESGAREDRPDALAFLTARGFVPEARIEKSELALGRFEFRNWRHEGTAPTKAGAALCSLHEAMDRYPDWQQRLWHLEQRLYRDVPAAVSFRPLDFPQWVRQRVNAPGFNPAACWIALDQASGDWIGMTDLVEADGGVGILDTGFTGMERGWRRQGLATALKLHAIQWARAEGYEYIRTDNGSDNPMYRLNLKLGFTPRPAWISLVRACV